MERDYREYDHFDKVIYVDENIWKCAFYDNAGNKDDHYLIGLWFGIPNEFVLPYNSHTRQYVGESYTGEETETA